MLTGAEIGRRLQRQRCKVCWNADGFDFHVPDEIWSQVVPPELQSRVVCLRCFDDFAAERGVNYDGHLLTLYFAGEQAAFEFQAVRSSRSLNAAAERSAAERFKQ